jgi:molecular chaperone DnaK (HSP70)
MKQYIVGIDLGTTNTVVAYARLGAKPGADAIGLFEIEQLVAPGEIKAGALLPSVRYHPAPGELAAGELELPWPPAAASGEAGAPPIVIGQLARKLGAQVPGRLVASAKSWLSHAAVDRMAPILPWGADAQAGKVSPVAASASYLAYVRDAWNWRHPKNRLEQQDLVLTLPASFDEGARALTMAAARQAGLPQLRLLEEPQAVFYDWLFRHRHSLTQELAHTRLVLVCDVGGGTLDLSLIKVDLHEGQPRLTRIGVGNHVMLGGDNMDLALAYLVETRMMQMAQSAPGAARLSAGNLSQLMERCRAAKELLLAANAPERTAVTLLGAGARMIGGARSVELTREEVERLIVDGFFPRVDSSAHTTRGRGGIVEFGLPYASDPAITRHIASFLQQHAAAAREAIGADTADAATSGQPALPDTLLLNGGVFRADALARRLQETLGNWRGAPLHLLHNDDPEVAVARGAVAYALSGQGRAPRIGGGAPRSYFLVLETGSKRQAEGGEAASRRAICILPRGSEPGREILLTGRTFALRVGQPVRFHLVSSVADAASQAPPRAGELVNLDDGNFVYLPPIAMVLQAADGGGRQDIPVQLATALTELGTLELHCVDVTEANPAHKASDKESQKEPTPSDAVTKASPGAPPGQRWLLEFQLRGASPASGTADARDDSALPPRFTEAIEKIDRIFGAKAQHVDLKEVKQIRVQLEQLLGSRERWQAPLLRQLFDALLARARGRRRSAGHERAWLNLAGYCLRPGFGYPLDDWRIEQLWQLFEPGVQHGKDSQVCAEWWTLWRRVAGGLDGPAQLRLLADFAYNLQGKEAGVGPPPAHLVKGSYDDMLRLGASLERIPPDYKVEIGVWLLDSIREPAVVRRGHPGHPGGNGGVSGSGSGSGGDRQAMRNLWALGRIGARQPFHGNTHDVVPPDVVAGWLDTVMALDWKRVEPAAFAAAHMARMTGDRARDLPADLREQIIRRLRACNAAPAWIAMVGQVVQLDEADERRVLGESLPPGLKLIA